MCFSPSGAKGVQNMHKNDPISPAVRKVSNSSNIPKSDTFRTAGAKEGLTPFSIHIPHRNQRRMRVWHSAGAAAFGNQYRFDYSTR